MSGTATDEYGVSTDWKHLSRFHKNFYETCPGADFYMEPTRLAQRPAALALVIEAIATWSLIESQQAVLLVRMIDTERGYRPDEMQRSDVTPDSDCRTALVIYEGIRNPATKRDVIRDTAAELVDRGRMPVDTYALIIDLLEHLQYTSKERNALVHWHLGITPELPNDLLVGDPAYEERRNLLDSRSWGDTFSDWARHILIYTEDELKTIIENFRRARAHTMNFTHGVSAYVPQATRDRTLSELRVQLDADKKKRGHNPLHTPRKAP
jgi:hypothetical protein